MKPVTSFEQITPNKQWQEEIRAVYDDDIDAVDLQVGLLAEPAPKGFGFSDTAFRVFILMASRRLKSDRFFTTDYRPEVYTQAGLDWVADNDMRSCPAPALPAARAVAEGREEPVCPLGQDRLRAALKGENARRRGGRLGFVVGHYRP